MSGGLIKGELESYEYTFSSEPGSSRNSVNYSPKYIEIALFFDFPSELSIKKKRNTNKENAEEKNPHP